MTNPLLLPVPERRANALAAIALILIITILTLPVVWGGVRLGQDTATQFYPWYFNLGERLRDGGIPEWNPHQFSGTPLAADPQSGWMYLPAMLIFTLLPLSVAVVVQIAGHITLAMTGTYWLARRVGLGRVGALVAGTALAGSGVLYGRLPSGPASYQVLTWIPWVLLGAEIAMRAGTWRGRVAGWALASLAVSQALAAWVGQVSYYTLLLLAAWILFRALWGARRPVGGTPEGVFAPVTPLSITPRPLPRLDRPSLVRLIVHGVTMLIIGLGLSAAGLLPRLEFNLVSNAAVGEYTTDVGGVIGGSSGDDVLGRLFEPSIYYPGAAVLALAVIGILVARGRYGMPFWLATALLAIVLTIPVSTPVHWLFYLLPQFETLHSHWPERVIIIALPPLAIMAGAGAQALVDGSRVTGHMGLRVAAIVLPPLALAGFAVVGQVSWVAVASVVGVLAIVAIRLLGPEDWRVQLRHPRANDERPMSWLPALLIAVVLADLLAMNEALQSQAPFGGFHRRDINSYYAPSDAASFLLDRYETEGPFRFAGYDPAVGTIENGLDVLYRYQFPDPITRELTVNNRATILGLEDTQGYNPLQLAYYVELVEAMNGGPQEYHGAALYPGGIDSPILDLLNARYLIVPATYGADRTDLAAIDQTWTTVYADDRVRVVENPEPLPRGWPVFESRTVAEGEALPLLASGEVDPRQVAIFEQGAGPDDPGREDVGWDGTGTVRVLASEDPDTVRVATTITVPHYVVLSEIAYPAWDATFNGEAVEVLTVDHGLRAVLVPGAGELSLTYDSVATRIGLAITLGTALLVMIAVVVALRISRRTSAGAGSVASS
ncbi:MAG TPA: hypothetical protein VGT61_16205 [Thermomicrobiales bacterium]|jgi:hypothetical protein|nr:hypothetical protein [Thermomicrobiales bacterium]